jgi:hypothetical protein
MFSGMAPFTLVHVLISLVGIATGFGVLFAMMSARRLDGLTAVFLTTTVLTSATGFFLPAPHFLPSHAIGILSLVVLAIAILARYSRHMEGGWRKTYVITASIAQYFNCFVLVVQLFLKVPALHELAPTGTEPPFAIAQGLLLVLFIVLTIRAVSKFREPTLRANAAHG